MRNGIRLDMREWNRSFSQYIAHTKRDLPTVINKKAFFVSRRAARNCYKASAGDIREAWNKLVNPSVTAGKATGSAREVPLGAIIVQMMGKAGKFTKKYNWPAKGFSPRVPAQWEMFKRLYKEVLARRLSARAYMAAGFKPAIKKFASVLGIASNDTADKKGKGYKWHLMGGADAAREGIKVFAKLWNSALAKETDQPEEKIVKVAGRALQEAIDFEVASMDKFVEQELQKRANQYSAKLLR